MTNVPSPYRVDFFNKLGKCCDLTVTFEKGNSKERGIAWDGYEFKYFRGIILKGISINTDTAFSPGILDVLHRNMYDFIICTDNFSPTGMLAILYMMCHHIKFYNEGDGGFAKSGKGIKEAVKRFFISHAIGSFSTSQELDHYFRVYGAPRDQIYRYPFTSVWKKDLVTCSLSNEQKWKIRRKLGIQEERVIIAVGQFIHRKGFDLLIKSATRLSEDVGIYFVGGTPTQEYLDLVRFYHLNNIHFVSHVKKNLLWQYYCASDLFVHPTREDIWGLVVNEAMACGLPVITTNRCIAGLEMVKNGKNGYIVPVDDVDRLTNAIRIIIQDDDLRQCFAQESLRIANDYTIEKMVQAHIDWFNKLS